MPINPEHAAWIHATVLDAAPGLTPRLRPRCACHGGPQWCSPCAAGAHEHHFELSRREGDLLGADPTRPAVAHVWLADRLCQRPCACPTCNPPIVPIQLDLFGAA